jgi:hypothetical protein
MSSQDIDERHSLTIPQFCKVENISIYTYYKIRKLGLGPRELRVPGTNVARVTPKARQEWHERMQAHDVQEQAEREHERRAVIAKKAGTIAAASPLHRCYKPPPPTPKKRGRPRKPLQAAE